MQAAIPSVAIGMPKVGTPRSGTSSLISLVLSPGFGHGVENSFHFQRKWMSSFSPPEGKRFAVSRLGTVR
jgi:hypothetical protein